MNKRNIQKNENKIEITATYKVSRSDELLNFLLNKCGTSRNNVKSLLSHNQVLVNGSVIRQFNFALAKDDEIKIAKHPVSVDKNKNSHPKKKTFRISILYEDDDFIAIDKPTGLLSVENGKEEPCAYEYVLQYLQEQNKALRPFVLHRIDKETSGVLVFAKDIKLHSMLRLRWNDFVKTRQYIAICEGYFEKKEDDIQSYLMENQNNMMYSTHNPNGQLAKTHYRVIRQKNDLSLVNVFIDTGRKNQIRVHMQDLGHPVVGDEKYGYTKNPLKRLGLHASKLEFIHPVTKELISISAPAPRIFMALFD